MIRKLGYIMLVITMALGHPITVLANTVVDVSQNDRVKNNQEMTDLSIGEAFTAEETEGITEQFEESRLTDAEQSTLSTEDSLDTTESVDPSETESSIEAETSESSSKDESSEASLDSKAEVNQEESEEVAEGLWGTVPWTWDEETKTIALEEGAAGTSATAPWKTYTNVVQISVNGKVIFPEDVSWLFGSPQAQAAERLTDLLTIEHAGNIDVSNVTNMDRMFHGVTTLKNIDVSNWNVSNVTDMNGMFGQTRSLASLDVSNWDVSNVQNMGGMFNSAESLTSLDVASWDVSSVTNMRSMFGLARSLSDLDLSNWDVSSVTDMGLMFNAVNSLTSLDLSRWDVSSVTNMSNMFGVATSLVTIDVSNWDVSNVTSMLSMFSSARALTSLDLSSWDVTNVTNTNNMFDMTQSLRELTLGEKSIFASNVRLPRINAGLPYSGRWIERINDEGDNGSTPVIYASSDEFMNQYDGSNPGTYVWERLISAPVTIRYEDTEGNELSEPDMLDGEVGERYISEPKEIPGWSVVETPANASGRFTEEEQEVIYVYERSDSLVRGTWGTVPWTWDEETRTVVLEEGTAGTPATSPWRITYRNVTRIVVNGTVIFPANSAYMFSGHTLDTRLTSLETIENAEKIDVSNVTNFGYMFHSASALRSVNVSNWDTSNGTIMNYMFNGNSSLTELDVSNWDTSNVTGMFFMFQNVNQLTELDVSNWETGNVTNINNMFNGVRRVTKLDVSNWDTSKVEGMQGVFQNTASLTEIDVSNWDTSKVKRTDYMFYNNLTGDWVSKLTTIDVSNWDTSNIENMMSMFGGARNLLHLDVSNWDTSSVTNMFNLFEVTPKIEELDLSNWDTTNVGSSSSAFAVASGMFRGMNGLKRLHLGDKTTFLHLAENLRPTLPENVMPAELYTGNWIFEKDLEGNLSTEHLTLTPTNFFHEYDGSKTGTYVWEKKEAQPVTVRYEDVDGNPLSTETILNGTIGLPYETEAKEIPGWFLTETPSNAFGTFTAEPQEVIYVYDRSDAASVTVKYEDTEGKQLSEPTILSGKVGLPYESEPKEIPGWYVPETPSNAHGIFGEEAQEVIYVYARSDAAPVTVKYEDAEGNQLSEPTILSGKVGLPYESEPKKIPGWYVPETPSNAHGIFGEDPQEVIYVYDRSDAAPVTVKYEDTEGNQLSEPTILSGKVGLPYESEPKEIPGWYVPETPSNAHGIFGEDPQEVIYVYDRSDAAPVTVKYEDTEGNQLSEPTILSGKVGLPYESESKEIPGWYVPEAPSNAHGIFGEDPQEVIYVYARSDAAPVTVKYEDTEGNQLSTPTILSGKVGLPYESEPKEIPGWYVPETPSNAHGIFGEDPQEVIYVYDRSDAAPVTVKYEDTEGNQLSEPTILSGKVGLPYESEPKEIPGWYVPETPSNAHGIFGEDPQEVIYLYDRSDSAPVTVKYEDAEGNQLSEPTILSGKVGLPYESEPKEIPGWYVPEAPSNAHGIFGEDPQEVIYVYDRSDAAPVTVKYEDTEGNQLSTPTILSGKVGLPYESEPKEIPGWYVPETPSNAHGIFGEAPQEVIYVYDRSDAAPVTVKYEDTEGNQLSESTILSGKVGLPYESEPKEIPGWYVPETPSNAQGIFSEDPQKVIYVYERSDAAPVTVKYEDTEGNQLSEPTILSGKVGLPYESEPKEIPGWYVPETPSNAQGIFSEDPQEVIYVYDRSDAAPVTVKYEDTEGNQLSEPTILNGKVGLPYESEPKEIPGWYVPETPTNAHGIFSEDAQEVIYVYDRSHAAPVTVKYEDTEGNQLSEPTILSGKVGLPYESEPKEIPGWYVPEAPSNAHGIFGEDPQEVIYLYDRSDAAPVIVKYEDTEGNQLSKPTILTGKVDMPYESKPKEISGWTVMEIPTNASGTFANDVQKVIYVYQKEGNNGGQTSPEKENPENDKRDPADPKLPHTGEMMAGQRIMLIVGSLLLLITLIIIFDKKKNKDR